MNTGALFAWSALDRLKAGSDQRMFRYCPPVHRRMWPRTSHRLQSSDHLLVLTRSGLRPQCRPSDHHHRAQRRQNGLCQQWRQDGRCQWIQHHLVHLWTHTTHVQCRPSLLAQCRPSWTPDRQASECQAPDRQTEQDSPSWTQQHHNGVQKGHQLPPLDQTIQECSASSRKEAKRAQA